MYKGCLEVKTSEKLINASKSLSQRHVLMYKGSFNFVCIGT